MNWQLKLWLEPSYQTTSWLDTERLEYTLWMPIYFKILTSYLLTASPSQEHVSEKPPDDNEITPSTSSYVELSEKHVSSSDIRPDPQAQPCQQTSKGRKRSKSNVLTATPVKQSIEQEAAARNAKQQKTKRKLLAIEPETEDEEEPGLLSDTESLDESRH